MNSSQGFPTSKYGLIVIDPPWPIKKLTHKKRPNQHTMDYPVMSISQIIDLPIASVADDKCWCFLWTTQKFLFESRPILEGWGFKHLLTMVWEKTYGISSGMPLFGFRWNAEFILVGHKGKINVWPKQPLIPAVFDAENVCHSMKPDIFYNNIQCLGEPRIDMFARHKRDGWDVWGNEVE